MLGLGSFARRRRDKRRTIPYGMFDLADYGLEAKNARILERIYHKGHSLAWDGKEVLDSLIAEHGPPKLPDEQRAALGRLFAVIMWGELAAWRISAELADELEPLEAKMAATSQAFDEARHFYVMYDYLKALDALPDRIDWGAQRLLEGVMNADHLAKKLVGMQLMVEPVALTLFHIIKKLELEPVLTHLLPYYERDEARHVALGIQYLPAMLTQMSPREHLSLFFFQFELMTYEIFSGRGMAADLDRLGVDPRVLMETGKAKQARVAEAMRANIANAPDSDVPTEILSRYSEALSELLVDRRSPLKARVQRAWSAVRHGPPDPDADIGYEPEVSDEQVPLIRGLGGRRGSRARA